MRKFKIGDKVLWSRSKATVWEVIKLSSSSYNKDYWIRAADTENFVPEDELSLADEAHKDWDEESI